MWMKNERFWMEGMREERIRDSPVTEGADDREAAGEERPGLL